MTPEQVRSAVAAVKERFLAWKEPAVELPPDSVIDDAARVIIQEAEAAMKERCAKIAEETLVQFPDHEPGRDIAAAIRALD